MAAEPKGRLNALYQSTDPKIKALSNRAGGSTLRSMNQLELYYCYIKNGKKFPDSCADYQDFLTGYMKMAEVGLSKMTPVEWDNAVFDHFFDDADANPRVNNEDKRSEIDAIVSEIKAALPKPYVGPPASRRRVGSKPRPLKRPRIKLAEVALSGPRYNIVCSPVTKEKAELYLNKLKSGGKTMGANLQRVLGLQGIEVQNLTVDKLIQALSATKKPRLFAESASPAIVSGWNPDEVAILDGIISAGTSPDKVVGNGSRGSARKWFEPNDEEHVKEITPVFISGALGHGPLFDNEDYRTALGLGEEKNISENLRPKLEAALLHINATAPPAEGAFVMMPGIGCGEFAGKFMDVMPTIFAQTLNKILNDHPERFSNIKAVCYDAYTKSENEAAKLALTGSVRQNSKLHVVNGEERAVLHMKPLAISQLNSLPGLEKLDNCKMYRGIAADLLAQRGNDVHDGGEKANATDEGSYHGSTPDAVVGDLVEMYRNKHEGNEDARKFLNDWTYNPNDHRFYYRKNLRGYSFGELCDSWELLPVENGKVMKYDSNQAQALEINTVKSAGSAADSVHNALQQGTAENFIDKIVSLYTQLGGRTVDDLKAQAENLPSDYNPQMSSLAMRKFKSIVEVMKPGVNKRELREAFKAEFKEHVKMIEKSDVYENKDAIKKSKSGDFFSETAKDAVEKAGRPPLPPKDYRP